MIKVREEMKHDTCYSLTKGMVKWEKIILFTYRPNFWRVFVKSDGPKSISTYHERVQTMFDKWCC